MLGTLACAPIDEVREGRSPETGIGREGRSPETDIGEVQGPILDGHVYCHERRDDVEIAACLGCARMRAVEERAAPPYAVCAVEVLDLDRPDPRFVGWWAEHRLRAR